jgi:hypothetical protein
MNFILYKTESMAMEKLFSDAGDSEVPVRRLK